MKIKLNTDAILNSGFSASGFLSPNLYRDNKIKSLKALVYYHRMEQIRPIEVEINENGDAFSTEFDCFFSPSEYELD
ncbi:hypothetical protein VB796_06695 [Arcicella sp. LKC2W]|uniref:hypothetical protein n=1 Tax=Arcicella sp. LKC2W TaxID=2984198 RepID=UPI002B1F1271|nr:hypothetical protein [Arcicella sp. LKC2W]MEA5458716.1 hypothetical protein [Arcicella sp. LKC2W]